MTPLNIANLDKATLKALYDTLPDYKKAQAIADKQEPGYDMHVTKRGKWLTVEIFMGDAE